MKFYTQTHQHYCGIDLHARSLYVCIMDRDGTILTHKNISAGPGALLAIIAPYRDDLVIGVECMFTWYWVADLCVQESIAFILGHALYMRAIHGGKAKNDKIDSLKIATLMRGGMFPVAYLYPRSARTCATPLTGRGSPSALPMAVCARAWRWTLISLASTTSSSARSSGTSCTMPSTATRTR